MSLLALARRRLAELSQRDVPKSCPNGTLANEMARDALSCPMGLSLNTVPTGQVRTRDTWDGWDSWDAS